MKCNLVIKRRFPKTPKRLRTNAHLTEKALKKNNESGQYKLVTTEYIRTTYTAQHMQTKELYIWNKQN